MNDFRLIEEPLRALTPLQTFLNNINGVITNLVRFFIPRLTNFISQEPMLLIPVGVIAITGVIGILGRLISRD